ncbi:MAG: hypothetical protein ACKOEX_00570 [Planctomycetia bacterium]
MNDQNDPVPYSIRLDSVWEPPAAGEASWRRSFGKPSGIGVADRILLVIDRPAVAAVSLNGVVLPTPGASVVRWEHDVTNLLEPRNTLAVMPAAVGVAGEPRRLDAHGRTTLPEWIGRVSLEILTLPADDR